MNTYTRYPVVLRKGRGMKVWSSEGKEYLDFVAGVAVDILGHCHPRVVVAIQKQAQRLIHVSNYYYIEPQIKLARLLVEYSFADKVFFCNSGAEANEAAIKLARKYSRENNPSRFEIITAANSFHGRTFGALSATGQEKYKKGFEPLLPGFKQVPFNDIDALRRAVTGETCAILLEPIQGEGGVVVPPDGYLQKASRRRSFRRPIWTVRVRSSTSPPKPPSHRPQRSRPAATPSPSIGSDSMWCPHLSLRTRSSH